jgi:hypothetical protein
MQQHQIEVAAGGELTPGVAAHGHERDTGLDPQQPGQPRSSSSARAALAT